jgi:hypothetical protein
MFPVVNAWLIWKACRPTKLSCFGILYLEKFAAALPQRWIWPQWVYETNAGIWHGEPIQFHGWIWAKEKHVDFSMDRQDLPKGHYAKYIQQIQTEKLCSVEGSREQFFSLSNRHPQ